MAPRAQRPRRVLGEPAPTIAVPFEATLHRQASVPAATLAHLTRTTAGGTVWDARLGHFRFAQATAPIHRDLTTTSRLDLPGNFTSGAPREFSVGRQTRPPVQSRFVVPLPAGYVLEHGAEPFFVLSLDGSRLVFVAVQPGGGTQLFLRPLHEFHATAIGTLRVRVRRSFRLMGGGLASTRMARCTASRLMAAFL